MTSERLNKPSHLNARHLWRTLSEVTPFLNTTHVTFAFHSRGNWQNIILHCKDCYQLVMYSEESRNYKHCRNQILLYLLSTFPGQITLWTERVMDIWTWSKGLAGSEIITSVLSDYKPLKSEVSETRVSGIQPEIRLLIMSFIGTNRA